MSPVRPFERAAAVAVAAAIASLVAALRGTSGSLAVGDPALLFWSVALGAGLCLGVSLTVVIAGLRRGLAEVALLGASLTTLSATVMSRRLGLPRRKAEPYARRLIDEMRTMTAFRMPNR